MIKLIDNFDGQKFMERHSVTEEDFHVEEIDGVNYLITDLKDPVQEECDPVEATKTVEEKVDQIIAALEEKEIMTKEEVNSIK